MSAEVVKIQTEIMKTEICAVSRASAIDAETSFTDVSSVDAELCTDTESCTDTDIEFKVRSAEL